jgi:zinc protease
MDQINRQIAPSFKNTETLSLLPLEKSQLDNGIELLTLQGGTQDVTKIDIFFPAGLVQAGKPLLASTVNNLIEEGTTSKTSIQISESLDFYGAHLGQNASYHHSMISLVTLTKHLHQTLPIVADLIRNPIFPQSELDIYLNNKKQEFLLDIEKVKTLASRRFSNSVFGANHPYGMIVEPEIFDSIHRDELVHFHKQTYTPGNCQILIAGQPGNNYQQLFNQLFGDKDWLPITADDKIFPAIQPEDIKYHHVKKDGSLQAALRIGRSIITRDHPDFMNLQVLNTILGGYFGSRLMTTIREVKGYSYGISSYIVPLKHNGFWVISTEVKGESKEDAIKDIFHEMEILRTQPIGDEELELVKNFMIGDLVRHLDGPFAISDNIKGLLESNMDLNFYTQMVQSIKEITSSDILKLSIKYLNPEDFYTIVAG